jgi:hypothetical protein
MFVELFLIELGTALIIVGGIILAVTYGAKLIVKAIDRQGAKTITLEGSIPMSKEPNKNMDSFDFTKTNVKKLTRIALKKEPIETNIKTDVTVFDETSK